MSGYARFHRSLIGHPAFRNDAEAMGFAYMVLRASWKETKVRYKGRLVTLQRGQLTVSQRDLASALDRDKAWIERLMKRLREHGMISQKYEAGVEAGVEAPSGTVGKAPREAGAAVITICNYDKYQHSNDTREAADEAQRETPREADARQTQGTEQVREIREEEKEEIANAISPALRPEHVVEFWNVTAERLGLAVVRKLSPERRRKLNVMIRSYTIQDFTEAIGAIEKSPFLLGDSKGGWRADFDFLLQKSSFIKLLEGSYDRSARSQQSLC